MTKEEMQHEIEKLYNQMTPENKAKARAKYFELLEEQEREASPAST